MWHAAEIADLPTPALARSASVQLAANLATDIDPTYSEDDCDIDYQLRGRLPYL